MIVIGIDPGLGTTGYGIVKEDEAGKLSCLAFGSVSTRTRTPISVRLLAISEKIDEMIKLYSPDRMAIEESFFAKDAKSALKLGHVRGALMLVGAKAGMPVGEYAPLLVKQSVVGYGKAEKEQVQMMVRSILAMKENPTPLDASDALAIAITDINHQKMARLEEEA